MREGDYCNYSHFWSRNSLMDRHSAAHSLTFTMNLYYSAQELITSIFYALVTKLRSLDHARHFWHTGQHSSGKQRRKVICYVAALFLHFKNIEKSFAPTVAWFAVFCFTCMFSLGQRACPRLNILYVHFLSDTSIIIIINNKMRTNLVIDNYTIYSYSTTIILTMVYWMCITLSFLACLHKVSKVCKPCKLKNVFVKIQIHN